MEPEQAEGPRGAAGSWGSGLGEQTFEGLAWGPGAHPQTCLDRQLTTKGVIQLRCTWLPGTPGNPRLGAALAENQDSSPRPPRQHPSIPASPGPPRPEPPPAPGTASSVPWAAPGARPAVPSSLGCGPRPPLSPGPGAPHSRHSGAGKARPALGPRTCHTDRPGLSAGPPA